MYDCIIVGGGISAFSAALFCGRRGLKILVVGKDIGGQANYTDTIENYPGIAETSGFDLVANVRQQAMRWGMEFVEAEVSKIKKSEDGFILSAYGNQYKSKTIILAFGKTPMDLGVPGETELKGHGVSFCATCDMPLYRDKTVAVAGIGDVNLDAILLGAKYAKKVYALSKTQKLSGHPMLLKAISRKSNIEIVPFVKILEIIGTERLEKLKLLNLQSGKIDELPVDGLFVELGYVVAADFVQDLVQLDDRSQIITNSDQSTNVPGLFACGDVTNSQYKQAVISAGQAATAALACFDYLARQAGNLGLTSDWTQIKKIKNY